MAPTVVAFDLYGTLLSTGSIAEELAKLYGEDKAKAIAALARRYQLEYTWRINSMGSYLSFSDLTRSSFRQATAENGVALSAEDEARIMKAYDGLDTFPEVGRALEELSRTPQLDAWIFSNGTAEMVKSSLTTSPGLSSSAGACLPEAKVVSVEPVRAFKPDRRAYEHLLRTVGKADEDRAAVWLVSSNAFDAVGAVAAGLRSAWVDRDGRGWVDGLGDAMGIRPTVVVEGVDQAIEAIKTYGQASN